MQLYYADQLRPRLGVQLGPHYRLVPIPPADKFLKFDVCEQHKQTHHKAWTA